MSLGEANKNKIKVTEYGTNGNPNFYWNIGGNALPTVVLGDPNTATPVGVDSSNRLKIIQWIANKEENLNTIETTYNNVTITATESNIDVSGYNDFTLCLSITYSGSPTSLQVLVKARSSLTSKAYIIQQKYIKEVPNSIGSGLDMAIQGRVSGASLFDITIQATGTTASDTFTVSDAVLLLGA